MKIGTDTTRRTACLAALTAAAMLVQGYHPYAEDAEIYLPGVLKLLNPNLYPSHAEFFGQHAGYSLYSRLIAASVQLIHLRPEWVTFLWQAISIFLLLVGTWRLSAALFEDARARWGAVTLMAALLTLPVAGTALYIVDQYLNPRNLAAFAAVFAVAETLHRKYVRAFLWLAFAAAVHPLMSSFAIMFCVWVALLERIRPRALGFAALAMPFGIFDRAPQAYHEVAMRQSYFFVVRWEWYEWLGLIGPVLLFWCLARWSRRRGMSNIDLVSRAMIPFILVALIAALVLSIPGRMEVLARFEPLRCLALAYMVLIVIGGGLLGQYVLKARAWRWLALFVPLSAGMFVAQRELFPASQHIEAPWSKPRNLWAQAFDWVREHTSNDAVFALDPRHMALQGEDENGFRARAQRSRLADAVKDKGAASAFPPLSVNWLEQVRDQEGWERFQVKDFERLQAKYGVSWIVVRQPGPDGLDCPYENETVRVCRVQ